MTLTENEGEQTYLADVACSFCKQDVPARLTWQSERTGVYYCIDQRIHECLRAWADRAFEQPMGVLSK